MNREAVRRMGWMLARMRDEARRRKAPVFEAEEKTEGDPFRILVFTMLSARTKDSATIRAVERLFSRADSPEKILRLNQGELEEILYGVGFYRVKAKNLLAVCQMVRAGGVPSTSEGLLALPGIGRKTANIILSRAFGIKAIGVDVHVHRISNRLGLVKTKKPEETEKGLMRIVPGKHLRQLNRDLVAFGQTVCLPRRPLCESCPVNTLCRRVGVKERCESCRFGN